MNLIIQDVTPCLCVKIACAVLTALALCGCSSKEFGSNCTKEPITIVSSRHQSSAATVIEPFIFSNINGTTITVGRYDAFAILSARAKENAFVAKTTALVHPILEDLPRTSTAIDVDSIRPKFGSLKGQDLDNAVLVVNELNVLFIRALKDGVALIGTEAASQDTIIQQYSASLKEGSLNGVRVMLNGKIVEDYCGITPHGT